jgi:hypothetical protein
MAHNGTATQTATDQRLYRIGEVSRLTELKPFVLRYWESEFPMLEPVKSPYSMTKDSPSPARAAISAKMARPAPKQFPQGRTTKTRPNC